MSSDKDSAIWLLIDSAALVLLVIFATVAVLLEPGWIDINSYLSSQSNAGFNYVLGIVGVTLIPFAYLLWRILQLMRLAVWGESLRQSLANKVLPVVLLVSSVAVLILLTVLWGEDGALVLTALGYVSPALFIFLACALFVVLYFLLPSIARAYQIMKQGRLQRGLKGDIEA